MRIDNKKIRRFLSIAGLICILLLLGCASVSEKVAYQFCDENISAENLAILKIDTPGVYIAGVDRHSITKAEISHRAVIGIHHDQHFYMTPGKHRIFLGYFAYTDDGDCSSGRPCQLILNAQARHVYLLKGNVDLEKLTWHPKIVDITGQ